MFNRPFLLNFLVLGLLVVTLAACGDTWEGLKRDTGENLEATGQVIEDAGEAVSQ
jgi:predicted small secreted protein